MISARPERQEVIQRAVDAFAANALLAARCPISFNIGHVPAPKIRDNAELGCGATQAPLLRHRNKPLLTAPMILITVAINAADRRH
jgi:hypothetical protein